MRLRWRVRLRGGGGTLHTVGVEEEEVIEDEV